MVVVTSPIGDQAPPALAAITMIEAKTSFSLLSFTNFAISEINTIVVVRLSNTAERKNANIAMIANNLNLLVVLMLDDNYDSTKYPFNLIIRALILSCMVYF